MLNAQEKFILKFHGNGHPCVVKFGQDYQKVLDWYQEPGINRLDFLIKLLTPLDRHRYFSFTSFSAWYSTFNLKIAEDKTIKPTIVTGGPITNEGIDQLSIKLLSGIIESSLTEHTMQSLVQDCMTFGYFDLLGLLLTCFVCDGKMEESTVFRLGIELRAEIPRWQALQLSTVPTLAEIEEVLTIN